MKRVLIYTLFTLPLWLGARSLLAEESPEADPPQPVDYAYSFAEDLFDQQDWFRAVGEYKRTLFLMGYTAESLPFIGPNDPGFYPRLKIGVATLLADQRQPAADRFYLMRVAAEGTSAEEMLSWWMGQAYFAKSDYGWAARRFDEASSDLALGASAQFMRGWSLAKMKHFDKACEAFEAITQDSPFKASATAMAGGLAAIENLPRDNPWTAGVLSALLPGAGQIYVGEYYDGLMALTVNGLFIWGIVYAFMNGNLPLGIVLAFFESGFYTGNIYAAANYAHKNNADRLETHLDRLEAQHGPPEGTAIWRLFETEWRW